MEQAELDRVNRALTEYARQVQLLQMYRAIRLNLTLYRIDEHGHVVPVSAREYFNA